MNKGWNDIMKQAQDMNLKMEKIKKEIVESIVEGKSGAGMVTVTMNGKYYVSRVNVDPSLLSEDKEMLEDLITAAVNDAVNKVEELSQRKMGEFSSAIGFPMNSGSKFPF